MGTQPVKKSQFKDMIGTWKMRNGNKVRISAHCVTTIDGILFQGWVGDLEDKLSYWDEEGNHFKYREFDLIELGRGENKDKFDIKHY